MWFHVLACDYDGTLATGGRIAPETHDALRAVRESGRRVLLVTGRQFEDLLAVCPEIDSFDFVVAENGAVLYDPRTKRVEDLAPPPPPPLLAGLQHLGVPFSTGRVIVSTVIPYEVAVLEAIRTLGLEMEIIFNKEAVMVLPTGVSKQSGLLRALQRLGVSRHNIVAVGDAENDHAFLACSGFAVAVANAVPALAARADWVTELSNGAGVRELILGPLRDDLERFDDLLRARTVPLGMRQDGTPFGYPVRGPNVLVTGKPGTGAAALTGVFVERLVRDGYVVCLLDSAGDFRGLAAQDGVVGLASESGSDGKRAGEVEGLLRHRSTSVVIDLSALDGAEKVHAAAAFLGAVQKLRVETGAPHWVVVDDAHRFFPAGGRAPRELAQFDWRGVCLVSDQPGSVARNVLAVTRHVLATCVDAVTARLPILRADRVPAPGLETGEALSIALDGPGAPVVERFRLAPRETADGRGEKYATATIEG